VADPMNVGRSGSVDRNAEPSIRQAARGFRKNPLSTIAAPANAAAMKKEPEKDPVLRRQLKRPSRHRRAPGGVRDRADIG
jgi:hypothetical protein